MMLDNVSVDSQTTPFTINRVQLCLPEFVRRVKWLGSHSFMFRTTNASKLLEPFTAESEVLQRCPKKTPRRF